MRKRQGLLLALLACLVLACLGACSHAADDAEQKEPEEEKKESVELQIYADDSLSAALTEAQAVYAEENPNIAFSSTVFDASGALVDQLEGGAYADALICASKGTMDEAELAECVDPGSRFNLLTGSLVMASAAGMGFPSDMGLEDLAFGGYSICMGGEGVPVGDYARQALASVDVVAAPEEDSEVDADAMGVEPDPYAGTPLQGMVRTQPTTTAVCDSAEKGECSLAFVYASDLLRFENLEAVASVPEGAHANIVFAAGVTEGSENEDAVWDFLLWCAEDERAAEIWEKWGFSPASE